MRGETERLRQALPPNGDPDRALLAPSCHLVKLQRKVIVGRVDSPIGPLFIKRYNVFALRIAVGSIGRQSPAARAAAHAARLAALGFCTPEVVGAPEFRRAGLLTRSFFVTRAAPGLTADVWWEQASPSDRRRAAWTVGDLFRRLHAAGVYHADLKDVNLLLHSAGGRLGCTLLDLERVRFDGVSRSQRLTNLTQLARTLGRRVHAADRMRFLRAYLEPGASRAEQRSWVVRVNRRADAKDRGKRNRVAASVGVSVAIVCQDEERHLRRCLESVAWCDERVVVDGGSRDASVAIARELKATVIEHPWPGYRAQKQHAFDHTHQPWVLSVDADERVTNELADEIQRALACAPADVHGFAIPRLVPYLGRWWYRGGWYPRRVLRLVRRDVARWGGIDPHDRLEVPGSVRRLEQPIVHYTYANVFGHLRTVVRFSEVAAAQRADRPIARGRLVAAPLVRFLRSWTVRGGLREGFPGFFVAATDAFYAFLRFAILHQGRTRGPRE